MKRLFFFLSCTWKTQNKMSSETWIMDLVNQIYFLIYIILQHISLSLSLKLICPNLHNKNGRFQFVQDNMIVWIFVVCNWRIIGIREQIKKVEVDWYFQKMNRSVLCLVHWNEVGIVDAKMLGKRCASLDTMLIF